MRSSTAMPRRAEKNEAEKARRRSSSVRHVSGIEAGVARPDCGGKVDRRRRTGVLLRCFITGI